MGGTDARKRHAEGSALRGLLWVSRPPGATKPPGAATGMPTNRLRITGSCFGPEIAGIVLKDASVKKPNRPDKLPVKTSLTLLRNDACLRLEDAPNVDDVRRRGVRFHRFHGARGWCRHVDGGRLNWRPRPSEPSKVAALAPAVARGGAGSSRDGFSLRPMAFQESAGQSLHRACPGPRQFGAAGSGGGGADGSTQPIG
jgi:hypothetical protein